MTLAPLAWAITTQLGQVLCYADCNGGKSWSLVVTTTGAALTAASAFVSYLGQKDTSERTAVFNSYIGVGIGLAFMFALLLQAVATLLLNPCQH